MYKLAAVLAGVGISCMLGCEARADAPVPMEKPARYAVRIVEDNGGKLSEFKARASGWSEMHMLVIIDGPCLSACTLYLRKDYNLDLCITENAVFGFHVPFAIQEGRILRDPLTIAVTTELWYSEFAERMPEGVQEFLTGKNVPSVSMGAEPSDFLLMRYEEASKIFPTCPAWYRVKFEGK